jgi:hypothetical protein
MFKERFRSRWWNPDVFWPRNCCVQSYLMFQDIFRFSTIMLLFHRRSYCHYFLTWKIYLFVLPESSILYRLREYPRISITQDITIQICVKLTNSIELIHSRESASCADTQELPSISWYQSVHYRFHKSSLLVLSWPRSIQSIQPQPISLKFISILSTHLRICLPSAVYPLAFRPITYVPHVPYVPHSC